MTRGAIALRTIRLLLWCFAAAAQAQPDDAAIEVQVERDGARVMVHAKLFVRATPEEASAVLIDYEGPTRFISDLTESKVLERSTERVVVSQKGSVDFGDGNTGAARAIAKLIARDGGVEIVVHAEFEPEFWIPPWIGPAQIESRVRAPFEELREEILRRKQAESVSTGPAVDCAAVLGVTAA